MTDALEVQIRRPAIKKNISRSVEMKATAIEIKAGVSAPGRTISHPLDYQAVVGLDVGDRNTHYCVLDLNGQLVVEGVAATREASLRVQFEGKARMRIALEAGTHSPWISRLLVEWGHDVIVANPRNVRMISQNVSKNDPADARLLARLAHVGPELLSPIEQRSEKTQVDLALVRARDVAVQSRTQIVNAVRGMVKSTGHRLPKSSTLTFARKAKDACPEALKPALLPLLRVIEELTREIELYEKLVAKKADTEYPETKAIRTIHGVGPLTALTLVLLLNNDRSRFRKSRDVGCYIGLRPKQRESGLRAPQLGITKAGDSLLRRLATQCAQYVLGPFGKDSALRRWGLSLALRGGKNAKKRAVIAVARKLVILMHRIWISQEIYEPLRGVTVQSTAA
jgi:transposase